MDRLIKQGNDILNSNVANLSVVGATGGTMAFFQYLELWVQVVGAILITLMLIRTVYTMYQDWKRRGTDEKT